MKTLSDYAGGDLLAVFESLFSAVRRISEAVRSGDGSKAGTRNESGEEQLALDVHADRILQEELRESAVVGVYASEEVDGELSFGSGEYAVCADPLDGSSLVDVNLSVGTIVGIYRADSFTGVRGSEQVGALIAVYGPMTTVFLSAGNGVVQFVLKDGVFVVAKEKVEVGEGKMFAPGNLRACKSHQDYLDLVNFWCREQYTLRYSGGMVPDINQILLKGKGIFSYPGYDEEPDGKLRLLFECAPMAFLMEQAGGAASDGKGRILEKPLRDLHQRTPIFIGSKAEVERCEKYLV